jgi:uncharacterized protein YndB with AHSA1/START domain
MTDRPRPSPTERREFTIIRVFDAPRELVFRAWITPASFATWFGGSESEVPVESVAMDVTPGGAWKATMYAGPERHEMHWSGEFQEIVEPQRLVLTFSDQPEGGHELVTVTFADLGDGRTEMLFKQTGGHMDAAGYERAKQGWGAFFDAMESTF